MEQYKLSVASSPHASSPVGTKNLMRDVLIALIPAMVMGVWVFGPRALTMTLELATRFLKDFIDGDLYFKTAYPEHNLIRARTQIKLVADMQSKWDEMNRIVAEVAAQVRGK